jgi:Domain of unknown function (DUF4386)
MTSFRKTALVGGLLYLITFVGSIASALLVGPVLNDPAYILGAGADQQIGLAGIFELVNVFALIGCGIAFFSVVRKVHEGLAIGYLATRLFEGAIITISVVSLLSIMTLHQQVAAGTDGEGLVPVAAALVAVRNWAIVIGSNMAPFNALMLGTALYRARLVPRAIPALGLIGAPILIAWVAAKILGLSEPGTPFHIVAVMPFFFWELALGLWLTFKGFNERSPLAIAERARRVDAQTSGSAGTGLAAKAGAA